MLAQCMLLLDFYKPPLISHQHALPLRHYVSSQSVFLCIQCRASHISTCYSPFESDVCSGTGYALQWMY